METINRKSTPPFSPLSSIFPEEQSLQSNSMGESGFCNNCGHNRFGFEKVDDPFEQGLIQSFDFEGKESEKPAR